MGSAKGLVFFKNGRLVLFLLLSIAVVFLATSLLEGSVPRPSASWRRRLLGRSFFDPKSVELRGDGAGAAKQAAPLLYLNWKGGEPYNWPNFFLHGFGNDLPEKIIFMVHGKSGSTSVDHMLDASCPETYRRVSLPESVVKRVVSSFDEPILTQGESVGYSCMPTVTGCFSVFLAPSSQ